MKNMKIIRLIQNKYISATQQERQIQSSKSDTYQQSMSIIPSQLTSINQRIDRRSMKSSSISKLNRQRSIRKYIPGQHQKHQQSVKRIFNDNEISFQISKEMKEIQQLLIEIKPQLQQIERVNNERSMREILFDLEAKINKKNNLLTQINNENKELKSAKKGIKINNNDSYNDSTQLNPQKQEKTFKLAHELKQQREQLFKIKNQHLQKKHKLQLVKTQVSKLQQDYLERCKKTKQKPVTYEMFKSLNEEKKKELENFIQFDDRKRRKRQTLKQMLKSNSFHNTPTKNKTEKNLKEIVNRKKIAQQALKTARKKYNQQIREFYAKLEFLRQEDMALIQTLRQKQVQYYTLQNKFNESRRHLISAGNKGSSQYHKLGDTLRYKGDYDDTEELRKTRKNKFSMSQNI